MNTFVVSEVRRAEGRLPVTTLEKSLLARSHRTFEAIACNLPDLVESSAHGFLSAVHTAFDEHRPLVLSPDDLWLCLAQGFAAHVNLHAKALRGRLVRHEGKAQLKVRRDDFVKGSPANDWPAMFSELSDRIHEHIGNRRDLVVADFSTTGPVERAASEVVLFDAVQSYFDYLFSTMCGIPEITLLGTAEDWLSIRRRAEVFAEFDLSHWTTALFPVLDRIVKTAQGDVDRAFWQSFFKSNGESGGPYVTGWINVLFPYVQTLNCSKRRPQAVWNEYLATWEDGMGARSRGGPAKPDFPTGLSSAPFLWNYLGTERPMVFTGGFVGVSQDAVTGAVRPAIGWAFGER